MATSNNTTNQWVEIPVISLANQPQNFDAYIPIIMMDGGYDEDLRMSVGRNIFLESFGDESEAITHAQNTCISTPDAIGYAVRGVNHE